MTYNAFIIDDEQPARDIIKNYLEDVTEINVAGEFADGFSAVKAINSQKPDIIFLDIQMPKLNGFEVLELLEHKPAVIFSTAYDHYAIKAFEVNAADYLLKPYSDERFAKAIQVLLNKLNNGNVEKKTNQLHIEPQEILHRIAVRTGQNIHVIPTASITHIEAEGDYTRIHTLSESFLKEKPMRYYEVHLNNSEFVRIHRSYIVNIAFIERLEYYDKDSYNAVLRNKISLKVSTNGYKALRHFLNL